MRSRIVVAVYTSPLLAVLLILSHVLGFFPLSLLSRLPGRRVACGVADAVHTAVGCSRGVQT
eukprot:2123873-Amphidinium_carterae.1